jgi:hypothetical protein
MNTIEKLLKLDFNKLQLPSKEVEITRLSELTGDQVIFKLRGVDSDTLDSIRDMATKGDRYDILEARVGTVVAGVVEPNLKEPTLIKHFGVVTPYDLVKKMLTPGESEALYEIISKLSGYDEGAVAEVKN